MPIGLFTSYPDEEEWWMAHRILIPAFGPIPIRKMFPQMMDIVSQMVLRWDRLGEHHVISCSDDFTRMVCHLFHAGCTTPSERETGVTLASRMSEFDADQHMTLGIRYNRALCLQLPLQ